MPPETSLIVAVRNGSHYVRNAVQSLLSENRDAEIIVVDDGSNDGSMNTISDLPVTVVHHSERRGIAATRNSGLQLARGQFVAFFDQDDLLAPEGLHSRIAWLKNNRKSVAVAGRVAGVIGQTGEFLGSFEQIFDRPAHTEISALTLAHLRSGIYFPLAIWLYAFRRSAILKVGEFDTSLSMTCDQEFLYRFLLSYPIDLIEDPIAYYRVHPQNTSKVMRDGKPIPRTSVSAESYLIRKQYGIPLN